MSQITLSHEQLEAIIKNAVSDALAQVKKETPVSVKHPGKSLKPLSRTRAKQAATRMKDNPVYARAYEAAVAAGASEKSASAKATWAVRKSAVETTPGTYVPKLAKVARIPSARVVKKAIADGMVKGTIAGQGGTYKLVDPTENMRYECRNKPCGNARKGRSQWCSNACKQSPEKYG